MAYMSQVHHTPKSTGEQAHIVSFDTDSYKIIVDNGASSSFTNSIIDYITPPVPVSNIILPNTLYAPHTKCRLLSPQHSGQEVQDMYHIWYGTWCATLDDKLILFWNQTRSRYSIPLEPKKTNVGIMRSAAGINNHYCKACVRMDRELQGRQLVAYLSLLETTNGESQVIHIPVVTDSENEEEKPIDMISRNTIARAHAREAEAESTSLNDTSEGIVRGEPITLDFILQEQDEEGKNLTLPLHLKNKSIYIII
jgi:hypothetical protein